MMETAKEIEELRGATGPLFDKEYILCQNNQRE